eukprot:2846119-Ditylum_brightwellii.AAC.2
MEDEEFGMFLAETRVFDLIRQRHSITQINSHIAEPKQIDFILGIYKVAQAMERYMPYNNQDQGKKNQKIRRTASNSAKKS